MAASAAPAAGAAAPDAAAPAQGQWWLDSGVLSSVLGALDAPTLSSAAAVCRQWNTVISSHGVWSTLLHRDFGAFLETAPKPYPPPPPTKIEMYLEQSSIASFFGRSLSACDIAGVFEKLPSARQQTSPPPPRVLDERSCRRMYRQLSRARGACYSGSWSLAQPGSPTSVPARAAAAAPAAALATLPESLRIVQHGYRLIAFGPCGREVMRLSLDDGLRRASGHVQLWRDSCTCWARAVMRCGEDGAAMTVRWTTTQLTDFEGPAAHPSLPYFVTRVYRRVDVPQHAAACGPVRVLPPPLLQRRRLEIATSASLTVSDDEGAAHCCASSSPVTWGRSESDSSDVMSISSVMTEDEQLEQLELTSFEDEDQFGDDAL